jgi:hypothetical protein
VHFGWADFLTGIGFSPDCSGNTFYFVVLNFILCKKNGNKIKRLQRKAGTALIENA